MEACSPYCFILHVMQAPFRSAFLAQQNWVEKRGSRFIPRHEHLVMADAEWSQKIDALNDFLRAITQTVWRKLALNDTCAAARTWTIVATDDDATNLAQETIRHMRHTTVDIEEAASGDARARKYGVVIAVTPLEGDTDE